MLDTKLSKTNWQSRFFQFFAGDLYDVIPEVANKFIPTLSVVGNCTYNPQQLIVIKHHNQTVLNTTTLHNCILTIQGIKIA